MLEAYTDLKCPGIFNSAIMATVIAGYQYRPAIPRWGLDAMRDRGARGPSKQEEEGQPRECNGGALKILLE
jgi:hypothetical protein